MSVAGQLDHAQEQASTTILLSDQARTCLADGLQGMLAKRALELRSLDEADRVVETDAQIAFISRDVTGLSTKQTLSPQLERSYELLRRSLDLQWVHIHSSGADRPIYGELQRRGVVITTSSGSNATVVAHTAIAGLLALTRRFPQLLAAQSRRAWEPLIGSVLPRDLSGQTAVVVGWGPIGREITALLAALGLRTVIVRRSAEPAGPFHTMVTYEQLHDVLPRADWLILACPLTAVTRNLIGQAELALLPPGAQVINVARGEVMVEPELIAALESGAVAGAFLDVFAHEPLALASPLWSLPNVIVTPHAAGHSDGHYARVAELFLTNLGRWINGVPLLNRVP
jgi:phosphoglycerate dehydrogenase-like enzyme